MTIKVGREPENLSLKLISGSDSDIIIPMGTGDGTVLSLSGISGILKFGGGLTMTAAVQGDRFVWSFTAANVSQVRDMEVVEFAATQGTGRRVLARGIVRIK